MADPLERTHGPLVPIEPAAFPDKSHILKGKYVTLEDLQPDHYASLWRNFDFADSGATIQDWMMGERVDTVEQLRKDLESIAADGVVTFAVKADANSLGPPGNPGEHSEVLGIIFYDGSKAENREVEVGMMLSTKLHRSVASTEAHYLWLRNVCEANSPGLIGGKSLPYRRVFWKCNSLNIPSKRAAERIGYQLEGTLRKNMIAKGRSRDTNIYAFVDDEWPAIKRALEIWLDTDNFDDEGRQRRRLQDIRKELIEKESL